HGAAPRPRRPRAPVPHRARGRDGHRRPREGPGRVPERRARRLHHRALGRHAGLQLLCGGRRPRHADHARDPRRRPPRQHAAPGAPLPRLRRRAARVRPRAPDPGARQVSALEGAGLPVPADRAWLARVVETLRERAKTLVELAEFCRFYLVDTITPDPKAAAKHLTPAVAPALADLCQRLAALPHWDAAAIEGAFQ